MNTVKWELEDLSFATLHPKMYEEIVRLVSQRAPAREQFLEQVLGDIDTRLREARIRADGHRAAEALLLRLPEDDRPRARLLRHLRPDRRADPGRLGARLLRGPGHPARRLEPAARAVQGLHRDAEVQHVPVAAHHGHRSGGQDRSRCRSAPTRCTARPSTASPRTGATSRPRWAASSAPTTWAGCASSWSGSGRPRTRASSSSRCATTSGPARCSCSPRAATSSRCPRGRPRSTSPTRCTPSSATAAWAPG